MSLVTRVSVAFLVALAIALGGFSACLYYVAGLRLQLALDQELEATLDRFPDRPPVESGRVTWAMNFANDSSLTSHSRLRVKRAKIS